MIVHFVAPSPVYERKVHVIQTIMDVIRATGNTPTPTEEENNTMVEMGVGLLDQDDWELMCERDTKLLEKADVAIFEVSDKATFGTGYLAAQALAANKPTLFLIEKGSLQGSFTAGLKHSRLVREMYDEQSLEDLVRGFLKRAKT